MAPEDAARLHMGVPHNPMQIAAVLLLDAPLDPERVRELLERRVVVHERFRQRVVESWTGLKGPRWVESRAFNLRNHFEVVSSRAPLSELVSERISATLNRRRPLWSAHLVLHPDGTSALMLRVHHCIADGASLVQLLRELDDAPHAPFVAPAKAPAPLHPRSRLRMLLAGALAGVRLVAQRGEPANPLRARLTGRKEVAVSGVLSLAALTAAAHEVGVTLNDLLLAAVSGALRKAIARRSGRVPEPSMSLHALVPVVARGGTPTDAGNRFASLFVPLPIGIDDVRTRASIIEHEVADLRAHGAVAAGMRAVGAAGVATALVERIGVILFSRKGTATVSNVRGPDAPIHICGAEVTGILVWAPSPGSIGIGVSLFSYAGSARISVALDSGLGVDAARFAADLEQDLAALSTPSLARNRG